MLKKGGALGGSGGLSTYTYDSFPEWGGSQYGPLNAIILIIGTPKMISYFRETFCNSCKPCVNPTLKPAIPIINPELSV